jgi:DNA-binding SARP family transcriptional activator
LSGADQELYDYLAEEVVGDLPEDLQQFLMRTSILHAVTPDMAAVVTDLDEDAVAGMTAAAERLTLLSRPSRVAKGSQRYHPLVREFLEARLRLAIGPAGMATLHRRAALAAALDWRIAAYHYREAGEFASVATTIAGAIPEIMGAGQHAAAIEEIDRVPESSRPPVLDLVVSRIKLQRRDYSSAIELSRAVLETVEPGTQESDFALLNLITLYMQSGLAKDARAAASLLAKSTRSEQLCEIAGGAMLMLDASATGSIEALTSHLVRMAEHQRGVHPHYLGVTTLNLAINYLLADQPDLAIGAAEEAIEALSETSSRIELSAALMARANPLTLLGRETEAREAVENAIAVDEMEVALERADLADSYVEPESAWPMIDWLAERSGLGAKAMSDLQRAWFFARRGRYAEANTAAAAVESLDQAVIPGMAAFVQLTLAYVAVASRSPDADRLSQVAYEAARLQGATRWQRVADLVRRSIGPISDFDASISVIGATAPWNITYVADLVAPRLDDFSDRSLSVLESAVRLHPGRWRFVLRGVVDGAAPGEGLTAGRFLDQIGDESDIARLRAFAKRQRKLPRASHLGRSLARRLAPRVSIEDQGRVAIIIGNRLVAGSAIRRKVLALLCFLLTRPAMSSTRDQVLDALWPELDPEDALNSLNQTVYFLRRVFEEIYVEDLSPGYLHHDSDLVWLDSELVESRSNRCRDLIRRLPPTPQPDDVELLAEMYRARFALDFEYEDWAAPHRDGLHASYLEIVERAVTNDLETGHFDRGIRLARKVLDVDPTAEHVEFSLLRLYRASGAHAAAAEQYAHYAATIREQLGIEPPPLDAL